MNINRTLKLATVLLVVMVLTVAVYAFAAANTVGITYAGDGHNTISGYTVQNVHYVLNATDPSLIDSVNFTTTTPIVTGSVVHIKLVSASTSYTPAAACTFSASGGGSAVSCTLAGNTVLAADDLRVIIAQ